MQVLFPKNREKFSEYWGKDWALIWQLEQKALSAPGDPAVAWFCLDQHDIRADFFNAVPGDDVIVPAACHTEKAAWSRHHNGADISFRQFDLNVADESQPLTGADADNLPALQVGEFDRQRAYLLLDSEYALIHGNRTVNDRLAQQYQNAQPTVDYHCHCEEAVKPTWQSPGASFVSAVLIDEWYQESAPNGIPFGHTSLRSSQ